MTIKLTLFDSNPFVRAQFEAAFEQTDVTITDEDFRTLEGDLVSPANSYGYMDGGIDAAYTAFFGSEVQTKVQDVIKRRYNGELLVGQAFRLPLKHKQFASLIVAPTMRVPYPISDYISVYLATRAALRLATKRPILMPGMGTGVGAVPAHYAARMMRQAYDDVLNPRPFPKSWREAYARRHEMLPHEQEAGR